MHQQQGEDAALLSTADVDRALLIEHLKRPQDPKVHLLRPVRGRS
jgi:hypothetical protein